MRKIAIIGFHNLHLMQFLYKYTSILDEMGVEYDVLFWKRDQVEYALGFNGNPVFFDYPTGNYCSPYAKIKGYLKCRKFFAETIKKNDYDKLILLTSQTVVALADVVLRKYKNKYIYDYRDLTMENHGIYKKLICKLIDCSYFTAISSYGFTKIIGKNHKLIMSHNCNKIDVDLKPENVRKKSPVKITFWGMIRQIEFQKKVCDFFGNDERFLLTFHGEGEGEKLERYCEEKGYANVKFTGRFFKEEIIDFIEHTDILLNLYENDWKQKLALTVKMYDGLRYSLPMIVMRGSYMNSYIGQKSFAFPFNFEEQEKEKILDWFYNLENKKLYDDYKKMLKKIEREEEKFRAALCDFLVS